LAPAENKPVAAVRKLTQRAVDVGQQHRLFDLVVVKKLGSAALLASLRVGD